MQAGRQACRYAGRQVQACKYAGRQACRFAGRQAGGMQAGKHVGM